MVSVFAPLVLYGTKWRVRVLYWRGRVQYATPCAATVWPYYTTLRLSDGMGASEKQSGQVKILKGTIAYGTTDLPA